VRNRYGLERLAARAASLRAATVDGIQLRYRITAAAAPAARTTVRVYGVIGESFWDDGITAAAFAAELDAIGPHGIDLHINSGGGSVFDAVAMHAALVNHPSDVTTYIDGVAASAASFLAMAGDQVVIEKPAQMMIHNASGIVLGTKAEMRDMADLLDQTDSIMAQIYADRSGRPAADFLAAMDRETWYTAAQAVDAGLADRVANDTTATAPADRREAAIRARARQTLGA